jgi:hypothetical protein
MARDLGMEYTFHELEEKYRIKFSPLASVSNDNCPGEFSALKPKFRENIEEKLPEHFPEDIAQSALERLESSKLDSKLEPTLQTYETLINNLFGLDVGVRNQGQSVHTFDPAAESVHSELYELSQAFLSFANSQGSCTLYRAVRDKSAAKLIGDTIDSPDTDEYLLNDSVVSHHTESQFVAQRYSDKIIVAWKVPIGRILLSIDHILDMKPKEAEHHVLGGDITVNSKNIVHTSDMTSQNRTLTKTVKEAESPHDMSAQEHREFAELVVLMGQKGTLPSTDDGKQLLRDWFTSDSATAYLEADRRNALRPLIKHL